VWLDFGFMGSQFRRACQLASSTEASNMEGRSRAGQEIRMLWTIFAILLLLWLLGWGFHIAGSLIHLILVIAVIVLLIEVITGRRAAV
jgi:fatty acid desaturase